MTEVVAALIWEGDKFMICQRPAHKARGLLWEFVGGKVEPGETKEQALIRECREELAVTLSVGDAFMDVVHAYPDITVHLALFNAALLAIYALLLFVFVMPDLQQEAQSWTALLLVAFFVLGNISFLLYDVVLGRIADLYVRRLRPKLFRRGL